ncbi:hypothetical protein CBS101457_006095 [Exobasidium rhododendri]|nr:hypothetical protein CBS101457_006095 [Exobasidium rhododendri]
MASFFSQASSYFGRSNISSKYTLSESSSTPSSNAGLWRIQKGVRGTGGGALSTITEEPSASAGTNGTVANERSVVSVWSHSLNARTKDRTLVIEVLKKEASTLTRLRHPCILEVVEPLEEIRSELIFATEPVMAPLSQALIASESAGRASESVQLDEVEIQKGLLQVARGLEFLHGAGFVHGNLTTESVLVNIKGDWKISGFAFLTPLKAPDGTPTPYQYPDYDPSLPPALSRNFDYLAPEFALDQKLEPANDMFALGCLIFAVHSKDQPPFRNRNSLQNVRQNADQLSTIVGSASWSRLGKDCLNVLSSLLTRFPASRLTASAFQRSDYFNNILTQTLKYMERDTFAGKSKEEKVQFLKGLLQILSQFSDRLLRRKVLPALLELMNDRALLPFILPNVFVISKNLSSIEFTSNVLPKLKPLFSVQDPPQNQLILLEQIELFVSKTSPPVFREQVTPLLYSALEAEQVFVQERALQTVPRLCEVLEYSHVKEVLFPKIAAVFTKTKVLSVKCNTLICFHSMISVLDKHTLTEKLVPILARIKTREPSVMIATLAVHEAMSKKVDRETLATSIIPQLWTMSMGAQLSADQFLRFMNAVDEMGQRVRTEHLQHLREVKRMQDHTESYVAGSSANGASNSLGNQSSSSGDVDFATLVGSGKNSGNQVARDMPAGGNALDVMSWDALGPPTSVTPAAIDTPTLTPSHTGSASRMGNSAAFNGLASFPAASSSSTSSPFSSTTSPPFTSAHSTLNSAASRSIAPPPASTAARPSFASSNSFLSATATPTTPLSTPPGWNGSTLSPSSNNRFNSSTSLTGASNYTMSLGSTNTFNSPASASSPLALTNQSFGGLPTLVPQTSSLSAFIKPSPSPASTPGAAKPLPSSWGGDVLQPTTKSATAASRNGLHSNISNAWSDFDPLN